MTCLYTPDLVSTSLASSGPQCFDLLTLSNQTCAISRTHRHFAWASQMEARSLHPSPEEWTVSDGLLPVPGLLTFIRSRSAAWNRTVRQLGQCLVPRAGLRS